VADGTSLSINFSPDGTSGADAIVLSNIWRPEIKPLLDAISAQLPGEFRIRHEPLIDFADTADKPRESVRTWSEEREREVGPPRNTPWWCLWPKLVDSVE